MIREDEAEIEEIKQPKGRVPLQEYSIQHHLNEILKEILTSDRENGLENFEQISLYIKKKMTKLSFQYFTPPYQPNKNMDLTCQEQSIIVST